MTTKQKEKILCYQCEKKSVKERFDLCNDCEVKHKEWKIKKQQEKMRGNETIRILRCDLCKGTTFRFVWEYDPRSEFNMIWCHDGIGFELEAARSICDTCGDDSDSNKNVELIDDIFGEWIETIDRN